MKSMASPKQLAEDLGPTFFQVTVPSVIVLLTATGQAGATIPEMPEVVASKMYRLPETFTWMRGALEGAGAKPWPVARTEALLLHLL